MRALALALALLPVQATAQERADVNIANEREREVQIQVFDQVCDLLLYRGVLIHGTSTSVACCTDASGRCSLVVEDRDGRREAFRDALGTVRLEPR
jgi:hypothetical protein